MADHEFMFALDLSDPDRFDEMLDEVARNVLGHVGYRGDVTRDLVALLRGALTQGGVRGPRDCRVQFSAHAGELHILVAGGDGREWRTKLALP